MIPTKMIPTDFVDSILTDYQFQWKKTQLRYLNCKEIAADHKIKSYILANKNFVYNIEYAGTDIQLFIQKHNIKSSLDNYDFYIIIDFEFSKLPLEKIECGIRRLHGHASIGGYIAIQSFFINYNSNKIYAEFPNSYDSSITYWIETVLKIQNYSNESLPLDNPLLRKTKDGELISGSDFMYVHGNIRFWTWK